MTKKDRIKELLEIEDLGKTAAELKAMKAGEVEELHKSLIKGSDMKVGDISAIISRRNDEQLYWLLNKEVAPYKKCLPQPKKPGLSPAFGAKDYAVKTDDGFLLLSKEEGLEYIEHQKKES